MNSLMLWTGRVLTAIFALFMFGASITPKLLGLPVAEATLAELGWPPGYSLLIGIIELTCLVLYLIPRTSVLGAVLMMALLGGAMATQIRVDSPLYSHVLFSVYLGLFMWGGLWMRVERLRALFPFAHGSAVSGGPPRPCSAPACTGVGDPTSTPAQASSRIEFAAFR